MFEKSTRIIARFTIWACLCLIVGIIISTCGGTTGHAVISFGTAEITSETPEGASLCVIIVLWLGTLAAGILVRDRRHRCKPPSV